MDDLAFDMNFDAETAEKIRQISAVKNACVEKEDYEQAKALKAVETQLKAIGVQLAKMEVELSLVFYCLNLTIEELLNLNSLPQ